MNAARAPESAVTVASDALAAVLRSVRLAPDPVAVWLVCADGPDRLRTPRDVFAVRLPGCVHDMPVSGYLELALAGATAVRSIAGTCCAAGDEPPTMTDARSLLAGGLPLVLLTAEASGRRRGIRRSRPVPRAASLPLPRRALLAPLLLTRLPHRPPTERERLLAALEELGQPAPAPSTAASLAATTESGGAAEVAGPGGDEPRLSSAPPAGAVFRTTGCVACAVCVKGCPTGALAIDEEQLVLTLTQDASRCTDCGECVRLCPENALERVRRLTWQDLRERSVRPLAAVATVACVRCGQAVSTDRADHGLCPVCAYRRRNPFGSALPPNLARR